LDTRNIVDAHHHLWNLSNGYKYPWLQDRPLGVGLCGNIAPIAHDYMLADLLTDMRNFRLEKSVHVEAVCSDPIEETRWLQAMADKSGFPNGIVAHAKLDDDNIEAQLNDHSEAANMRGIRHILNWHENPRLTFINRNDLLTDAKWRAGFGLLKKFNLSFDLQIYPSQMKDAANLAAKYPETLIILNHTGMPVDRDESGINRWRSGMAGLAKLSNVVVKISGLGMVDWKWSEDSIRPYVLQTIECFGVDRVMFASNFPVDKLYSSFDALYGAFERITAGFSETEKDQLFRANATRFYRL
jgi:predicted TIM-barrel fold metal-dependent hydrolase